MIGPGGGGDGGHEGVEVLGDVAWGAEDLLRDPAGPPHGDLPGADLRVEAGHPVAQDEGVAEVGTSGGGGHVVRGGEGCGGGPGDGWDAEPLDDLEVPGGRCPVVEAATGSGDVGRPWCFPGLVAGQGGVGVGPLDGQEQHVELGGFCCCPAGTNPGDEVGGGGRVVVDLVGVDDVGCHASSVVEDPFEWQATSPQFHARRRLVGRALPSFGGRAPSHSVVEPGERQRAGVETLVTSLRPLPGLRSLDAASPSGSTGSTTEVSRLDHQQGSARPPNGTSSLVEPGERQRAGVETLVTSMRPLPGSRGLDAASPSGSTGSTTEVSRLDHQQPDGCWSSPASASEPASRPS